MTKETIDIWPDKFLKRELLTAGELAQRFNILNPRSHPESQRSATESSLDTVGWFDEISLSINGDGPASLLDNPDAVMFDGHERVVLALARAGEGGLVPVKWYGLTPAETDFALLVKDQITEMAETKSTELAALLERTKTMTVDPRLAGMLETLKQRAADGLLNQQGNGASGQGQADFVSLSDRFIVPPFSVLDARQGYWQERKRAWLVLGIQSELGRGENLQGLSESNDTDRYSKQEYLSRKPNATPGGSPLEAATLKNGKTVRGDGRGRPLDENPGGGNTDGNAQRPDAAQAKIRRGYARTFGQDLMRGEHKIER
jgi:hypothetical protein